MKIHGKRIIVLIILCIFLMGMLWYQIPVKKELSTTLCSIDGQKVEVVLKVSWHRYLLGPTRLKGTIMVDNTIYYSLNDTNMAYEIDFWEGIEKKIKGKKIIPPFIVSTSDALSIFENFVELCWVDENFGTICLLCSNNDNEILYYGPANNEEEARQIEANIK